MFYLIKRNSDGTILIEYNTLITLSEHDGIELLVKVLRLLSEYTYISNNRITITSIDVSACNNKRFCIIPARDYLIVRTYLGDTSILVKDIPLVQQHITTFLSNNYGNGTLDFSSVDPKFLEQVLGIDIPFLVEAKTKKVALSQLRNFSIENEEGSPIEEGRYYKQIVSNSYINVPAHINNHVGQTNEERTKLVLEQMQGNRYGETGEYIILYNKSFVIRDGEHRAAALRYLYGDIEIPVLVLLFSHNYYSYKLYYQQIAAI